MLTPHIASLLSLIDISQKDSIEHDRKYQF